jgi:hemolysin III
VALSAPKSQQLTTLLHVEDSKNHFLVFVVFRVEVMKRALSYFEAEVLNSITHALGILFGCIFIPELIGFSVEQGSRNQVIGVSIYGLCYVATFTFSTLYHGIKHARLKQKMELLDHVSIYLLIAATYTPFILRYMLNSQGTILLSAVWGFVITGILFEWYYLNKYILVSVAAYISISLLFFPVRTSFFANMPAEVVTFIYTGIALYLLGVIFFFWRKLRHHHALWHLFVLAGSICHFQAVWLSVKL